MNGTLNGAQILSEGGVVQDVSGLSWLKTKTGRTLLVKAEGNLLKIEEDAQV